MNSAKSDATSAVGNPASIAAVVVTYNRLALLQECVAALRSQTRRPDEIIVVNNSSTDGTAAWLADQTDLTVITQPNSGSSGGQYTGIKTAYHRGHNWFWCMDDDTIPDTGALATLTMNPYYTRPDTGFLSSLVVEPGGSCAVGHLTPSHPAEWAQTVLSDGAVRVSRGTFVGLLVSRVAISEVGLPVPTFFIMHDDTEFTRRVTNLFRGYCVLTSRVLHKTPLPPSNPPDYRRGWKYLYIIRNEVLMVRLAQLSLRAKTVLLTKQFYQRVREVLSGTVRPVGLVWFTKGLFARVSIERP